MRKYSRYIRERDTMTHIAVNSPTRWWIREVTTDDSDSLRFRHVIPPTRLRDFPAATTGVIQPLTALCVVLIVGNNTLPQRNKYTTFTAASISVSYSRPSQTNLLCHYNLCCFKSSSLNLLQTWVMLSLVIFLARLLNQDPYRLPSSQDIEAWRRRETEHLGVSCHYMSIMTR